MRVTLFKCERCSLVWVADEPPGKCPKCNRNYSGEVTIRLAGQSVKIASVRLFGENPLRDRSLQRGLDTLRLGIRCPHGQIADYMCGECHATTPSS